MKSKYMVEMNKQKKRSIDENMKYLKLMTDDSFTKEQESYIRKALSYCWVDGLVFDNKVRP